MNEQKSSAKEQAEREYAGITLEGVDQLELMNLRTDDDLSWWVVRVKVQYAGTSAELMKAISPGADADEVAGLLQQCLDRVPSYRLYRGDAA